MNSFSSALRFILAQQTRKVFTGVSSERTEIRVGAQRINAEIYSPQKYSANPILFLHGMSILGIADPRQKNAASALASAGFRVICPELAEIHNLRIRAKTVAEFTRIVSVIASDPQLCPSGRLALFAPSFSGAICLRAAAEPLVSGKISAVCALGTMAGIRAIMEYLFFDDEADRYARYVVLANYMPFSRKFATLAPAFRAMALDNWYASAAANHELTGMKKTNYAAVALTKLSAQKRNEAIKIRDDGAYRKEVFARLLPYMEKELSAYAVLPVAQNIRAPVFLLHGATDNVIPASESRDLAHELAQCRLVISPFIGHAETAVSFRRVADIWRLVSGFAYFFRHAAR